MITSFLIIKKKRKKEREYNWPRKD